MTARHTPGPWTADTTYDGALVLAGNDRCIANCREGTQTEDQANARLIAAAPDLLDALDNACRAMQLDAPRKRFREIDAARAAIAKATT